MKPHIPFFAGIIAANLFISAIPAQAQSIYTSGHADVGVGYDDAANEFEPHWHLGSGAVVNGSPLLAEEEFEPADLIARATDQTYATLTGMSSSLGGLADGSMVFAFGRGSRQPNLGFATEELAPAEWSTSITFTLTSMVRDTTATALNGQFALYETNSAATSFTDVLFSSANPSSTSGTNSFSMAAGFHEHFLFVFTQPGIYDLTFNFSGTHATDGNISTNATFRFHMVPEPTTATLLLLGGLGALLANRRRGERDS